jgi:hypothetical protein
MQRATGERGEMAVGTAPDDRHGDVSPYLAISLRLLSVGPLLILILLIVVVSLLTPHFLTPRNLSNILAQTAVIAIVAMGQHLVILTKGSGRHPEPGRTARAGGVRIQGVPKRILRGGQRRRHPERLAYRRRGECRVVA